MIKVETTNSSMVCKLVDYEGFVFSSGLIQYESTSKSDEVADETTPSFARVEIEETATGENS